MGLKSCSNLLKHILINLLEKKVTSEGTISANRYRSEHECSNKELKKKERRTDELLVLKNIRIVRKNSYELIKKC